MVSYKESYMTKQAGWLSDAWGNLTNSISNGLMDAQEGISNFFGGNDTAVGRLFAPSLDRQAKVRLGFRAPTGGQPGDYFDQVNKHIDQRLAHLQRADQGLEKRTQQELAAKAQVKKMIASRNQKKQPLATPPPSAQSGVTVDKNGQRLSQPGQGASFVRTSKINGQPYYHFSDGTMTTDAGAARAAQAAAANKGGTPVATRASKQTGKKLS